MALITPSCLRQERGCRCASLCFIPYVRSRNFFCISQTLCDKESSFKTKVFQGGLRGPCWPCRWTSILAKPGASVPQSVWCPLPPLCQPIPGVCSPFLTPDPFLHANVSREWLHGGGEDPLGASPLGTVRVASLLGQSGPPCGL